MSADITQCTSCRQILHTQEAVHFPNQNIFLWNRDQYKCIPNTICLSVDITSTFVRMRREGCWTTNPPPPPLRWPVVDAAAHWTSQQPFTSRPACTSPPLIRAGPRQRLCNVRRTNATRRQSALSTRQPSVALYIHKITYTTTHA